MSEHGQDFISKLFAKLSLVKKIEAETGRSTGPAQKEVLRQISQVSKVQGGNPISGRGVTKSGKED